MLNGISILEKINSLGETSTIEEIMEVVEYDFKDYTSVQDIEEPIEKFITWKNSAGGIDCEKDISNFEMYKALGWLNNDVTKKDYRNGNFYFDIIYSFTNLYALALTTYYPKNFYITKKGHYKVRKFEWEVEREKHQIPSGRSSQFINSKLFLKNTFCRYEVVNSLQCIKDFAKLTHSMGNFMPCPAHPFNQSKGLCDDVKDILDLMYIKVKNSEEIKYSNNIVKRENINEWKKWFDNNGSRVFIDSYMKSPIINNVSELSQMNEEDFQEFLNKINSRIRIRGLKMIIDITKSNEVRKKSLLKIEGLKQLQ